MLRGIAVELRVTKYIKVLYKKMVTSNILTDVKVVKMAEQDNSAVVLQRTLLGDVNEYITCPLCRGYYIDATTIVECLHSFCRSCIIKHLQIKSYCPVCEMMINSAKPNIKLDKALQDIVYKLVPGLFQKEMERRQQFYSSRPGPAASATPEQRGEDTERIIFSPEDVISFSLEFTDATDTDSISSKSSDSNDPPTAPTTTRRFLQCPAVVNISHLKKFLSMKFDIDSSQFAIDILYKRVSLPDYYTLMDIAYIYNWKRNEPMRFFYQIIDYIANQSRLFDIHRKGSHFQDRKSSPASTVDTNVSSPLPNINDSISEVSSGTNSPMPEDSGIKTNEMPKGNDKIAHVNKDLSDKLHDHSSSSSSKCNNEDVEKSQFLNSFELTAKSNSTSIKSPVKTFDGGFHLSKDLQTKLSTKPGESVSESLKRKIQVPTSTPELKKIKIELQKTKIPPGNNLAGVCTTPNNQNDKLITTSTKLKENDEIPKSTNVFTATNNLTASTSNQAKEHKQQAVSSKQKVSEGHSVKRITSTQQNVSPKCKNFTDIPLSVQLPSPSKSLSPHKLLIPKLETQSPISKPSDVSKPVKKMPDLKPGISVSQTPPNKNQPVNKLRMDLLANNSDPTMDRSKILSQVKSSLCAQSSTTPSGDPLKSLFDSCKINIPSSLSITLTDQKQDPRNSSDTINVDIKKGLVNKNISSAVNPTSHKVPSPPVHNYIEILKLPDTDPKKINKSDGSSESKLNVQSKSETAPIQTKLQNKPSESSAKGPVPNLKPIADAKINKQSVNFVAPITFQQTFEQQLQTLQGDKKSKLPKTKTQMPKLMPATPKSLNAAGKSSCILNKPNTSGTQVADTKTSAALDLSSPHSPHNNIQNQSVPLQTFDKAFETMQSIANLAKKQSLPMKGPPPSLSHSGVFPITNRPNNTGASPLRIPTTGNINQIKPDKVNACSSQVNLNRHEMPSKGNQVKQLNNSSSIVASPNYQNPQNTSPTSAQPSPRSQTRSPSSSPKLVIAEEKQGNSSVSSDHNINQTNQISSTYPSNINMPKSELHKVSPGPSKTILKPMKPINPAKISGIRQPITPTLKQNPTMNAPPDYITRPEMMAHAMLRHHMEVNWMKVQRQYLLKNMSNMSHQSQNEFTEKDKQ